MKTKPMKLEMRDWLNKGTQQARATVSASYKDGDLSVDWTVADCNRQICLDFHVYGCTYNPSEKAKKQFNQRIEERLKKVNILIDQLAAIDAFLVEVQERFNSVDYPASVEKEKERKLKEKEEDPKKTPRVSRSLRDLLSDID